MTKPAGQEKRTILIVEDDPDIRETLGEILGDEGYTAIEVADGKAALTWLQQNPRPCLILLDLMMPVMSGWEFRSLQQVDPAVRDVPVVIVSGVNDVRTEARRLAAQAYINKPIDVQMLLATVRNFCN